jgi:hypothetical protein
MSSSSSSVSHRSRLQRYRPPSGSRSRSYRNDAGTLPADIDPAVMLAAIPLVRTLRKANGHALLHGGNGTAVILVPDRQDLLLLKEAGEALFRATRRKRRSRPDLFLSEHDADAVRILGTEEKLRWGDAEAKALLAKHGRVLAFTTAEAQLPSFLHLAADAVVPLEPCDARALRAVLHALFGQTPGADELPDVSGLSLTVLAAALRPRASLDQAMAALHRLMQEPAAAKPTPRDPEEGPTLDDLHGLGEAGEWGKSLAIDVEAFQAGEITAAEIDQGAVLHGPPGTGKTIAAQAIASTCKVPIFIHSLARWQATGHLGDLLKAMRKAFAEAIAHAPCILFLDEIDSFGDRHNAEPRWEQYQREVINGFLECLDGAESRKGVIVIGATNLPEKIDPAILRPGRLERLIAIPLPDAQARAGILRFHLAEHLPGADLMPLAQRLEGLSGADLEKIVRDAKRKARRERRPLHLDDLNASTPRLVVLSDAAYHRTCLHEAAHALVGCLVMPETVNPPLMARVFREAPPGLPAGETLFGRSAAVPLTRTAYLGDIAALLAGLVAETMLLGEHCSGSGGREGSDLHHATRLALALEASIGMGEQLTYRGGFNDREFLSLLNADADLRARVDETLHFCRTRAEFLLAGHRAALLELTEALGDKGQIDFAEIRDIVQAHRPDPVLPSAPGLNGSKRPAAKRRREISSAKSRRRSDEPSP